MTRLVKRTVAVAMLGAVTLAVYAGYYVYLGGSVSDITGTLRSGIARAYSGMVQSEGGKDPSEPAGETSRGDGPDERAGKQARKESAEWARAVEQQALAAPAEGGELEVFFAPAARMSPWGVDDYLLRLIRRAEKRIDCAFYELQLETVAEALIERHRQHVKVAIVSDSNYRDREAVQACIRAGIPVVFDEREAFMHNKFCVVDGRHVWTGSTNISWNGMYRNNNNALLITSPRLAANYTNEFCEMFVDRQFGGRSPRNTPHPLVQVGSVVIENYFAPEDNAREAIVATVAGARKAIDFMAFSFTSKEIAEAMAKRLAEGVRIRGLFEARNARSTHSRDDFLEAHGAAIFLDSNPYSMHHKVIIVDGERVITGSYNFSKSADTQNDENVLIVHDATIAALYTREFERLLP